MSGLDGLIAAFVARGDIGHLALFAWALAASWMAGRVLRDLEAANARFETFLRELDRFNERFAPRKPEERQP